MKKIVATLIILVANTVIAETPPIVMTLLPGQSPTDSTLSFKSITGS